MYSKQFLAAVTNGFTDNWPLAHQPRPHSGKPQMVHSIPRAWLDCSHFLPSYHENTYTDVRHKSVVGYIETGHYSAVVYLCGAWYRRDELARRLAIINVTTAIGPMFSSYLQAAAYTGLNGVHGKAGWQWLFIIDGMYDETHLGRLLCN